MTAKGKLKRQHKPYITVPKEWACTESTGPGPFITRAKFKTATNKVVSWSSRQYRKHHFRLDTSFGSTWWAPGAIGWWIGVLFAIGATFFALGSIPPYASAVGNFYDSLTYFIGSIFFTSAALLQYLETSSTPHQFGGKITEEIHFLIWEPKRIDWWSTLIQLVGTVFLTSTPSLPCSSPSQQCRPNFMYGVRIFTVLYVFWCPVIWPILRWGMLFSHSTSEICLGG
ncbi:hypothetical protein [Methanobacterium petrolearium]|uniref:hypothetical protein n=1 Tax=Methanobacterium petrolearium TaxID=710190 RepID=UPI003081BEA1